jgi:predicted esterase
MMSAKQYGCLLALIVILSSKPLFAQEDVADVPTQDLRANKDESKRFLLLGPMQGATAPEAGFGLVIVLPGGDGSADFQSFVKRIYKNALPAGYLLAQPVAVQWAPGQPITWPTAKNKVPKMKFTTEEFVQAVIDDVARQQKLSPEHIFTLSWSSGGPAAYAISLTSDKVKGSLIAMSVFKPNQLPPLASAKDQAYFLYHSPQDKVIPISMVQRAVTDLEKNGAKVKLQTYLGGHGWRGDLYNDIHAGIDWLQESVKN